MYKKINLFKLNYIIYLLAIINFFIFITIFILILLIIRLFIHNSIKSYLQNCIYLNSSKQFLKISKITYISDFIIYKG